MERVRERSAKLPQGWELDVSEMNLAACWQKGIFYGSTRMTLTGLATVDGESQGECEQRIRDLSSSRQSWKSCWAEQDAKVWLRFSFEWDQKEWIWMRDGRIVMIVEEVRKIWKKAFDFRPIQPKSRTSLIKSSILIWAVSLLRTKEIERSNNQDIHPALKRLWSRTSSLRSSKFSLNLSLCHPLLCDYPQSRNR